MREINNTPANGINKFHKLKRQKRLQFSKMLMQTKIKKKLKILLTTLQNLSVVLKLPIATIWNRT